MDTTALKSRYNNNLPADVNSHIELFSKLAEKDGVLSVKLLSNFGKDIEMSLKTGTPVYRGLIVQLSGDYKLSSEDRLWLHPELCKGRTMYKGGSASAKHVDLGEFNSSVGYYTTHTIDEIGGYKSENSIIVDSGLDKESDILTNSWLLSKTSVENAYKELVSSKMVKNALEKRNEIAMGCGTVTQVVNSNYNMLYTNGKAFYFYNHAIKPSNGKAILGVSPLMGCAVVKGITENHIESDLLSTNEYIDVNNLKADQRKRVLSDCSWDGKSIINTYTMRKPIEQYQKFLEEKQATMYRMENGYFSANPIHSKLPADIVLFLTPQQHLIPSEHPCHQHTKDGIIDVPATAENIQKLMQTHWKTLISKKYVKGDNLLLPRKMIQESLV